MRQKSRMALRIGKRILDRIDHMGRGELGKSRTVDELHETMNDALRMNDHFNAIGRNSEKEMRLNHLKPFVHQRRGVYANFRSHLPRRMGKRFFNGDAL